MKGQKQFYLLQCSPHFHQSVLLQLTLKEPKKQIMSKCDIVTHTHKLTCSYTQQTQMSICSLTHKLILTFTHAKSMVNSKTHKSN